MRHNRFNSSWLIYLILFPNRKGYVGIACSPYRRMVQHVQPVKSFLKRSAEYPGMFERAILKPLDEAFCDYGFDDVLFTGLLWCKGKALASKKEAEFITWLNTKYPDGYNQKGIKENSNTIDLVLDHSLLTYVPVSHMAGFLTGYRRTLTQKQLDDADSFCPGDGFVLSDKADKAEVEAREMQLERVGARVCARFQ